MSTGYFTTSCTLILRPSKFPWSLSVSWTRAYLSLNFSISVTFSGFPIQLNQCPIIKKDLNVPNIKPLNQNILIRLKTWMRLKFTPII